MDDTRMWSNRNYGQSLGRVDVNELMSSRGHIVKNAYPFLKDRELVLVGVMCFYKQA